MRRTLYERSTAIFHPDYREPDGVFYTQKLGANNIITRPRRKLYLLLFTCLKYFLG